METLLQDVRYALRQLRKSPGFALIAVLTLSLGVGAATAIFSVVNAVILRPLPYDRPELIYAALSGVWNADLVNLQTASGPVSLQLVQGSDNFFDVFGVAPILGRTFRPGEDEPGKNDVAVLSYTVWQTNFGGRSDVG